MLLSEAILLGSTLKPQVFGPRGNVGSCALRAAADAMGMTNPEKLIIPYTELESEFPILGKELLHPEIGEYEPLLNIIYSLNDSYRWSRERIAAWVATIEPKETETQDEPITAEDYSHA